MGAIVGIVIALVVFVTAISKSRTTSGGVAPSTSNDEGIPFFKKLLGGDQNAVLSNVAPPIASTPLQNPTTVNYGPTLAQLGVKPGCFLTSNSQTTGSCTFVTKYAQSARGISIDGNVLFDVTITKDGAQSAVYPAGQILDRILVHGPGGDSTVQVYFPTEDTSQTSQSLVNGPIGGNQDTSLLLWPADDTTPATLPQIVEV